MVLASGEVTPLTGRMKLVAAGKSEPVSLSLVMELNNLEVDEALYTMATLCWAEGVWMNMREKEQQEAWRRQIFEVQR